MNNNIRYTLRTFRSIDTISWFMYGCGRRLYRANIANSIFSKGGQE